MAPPIYKYLTCLSIGVMLFGCTDKAPLLFVPVPDAVSFSNNLVPTEEFNMYLFRNYYNGGGVAAGDVTGDGLPDLFFTGNMVSNRLYKNLGNMRFQDITEEAGLLSHGIWSTGVSMGDVNSDGWIDIFVSVSGPPSGENRHNRLYINQQDGTFTEMSKDWGVDDTSLATHSTFFDYDMDGLIDLLVIANSDQPLTQFRRPHSELRYQTSEQSEIKLYKNERTRFTDVTSSSGLYENSISFPLSAAVSDINLDQCPDLYIANDFFERDYLYINQCDGTFKEYLESKIQSHSKSSMGSDIADVNRDGWPDIFVTDMLPWREDRLKSKMTLETYEESEEMATSGFHHTYTRNTLQINRGGTFMETGRYSGVEASDWSWAALIADYDHDGRSDIYVTNGIYNDLLDQDYINLIANPEAIQQRIRSGETQVIMNLLEQMNSEPLPNRMYRQENGVRFDEVSELWGLDKPGFSSGAAWADLDKDGDLDIVVNELNGISSVYENKASELYPKNGWLTMDITGPSANPLGIGAHVTAHAGDTLWVREHYLQRGFQSSVEPGIHIGTGNIHRLDSLIVQWPDGKRQVWIDDHHNDNHTSSWNVPLHTDLSLPLHLHADYKAFNATAKLTKKPAPQFPGDQRTIGFDDEYRNQGQTDNLPIKLVRDFNDTSSLVKVSHNPSPSLDFKREPHLRQLRSSTGPAVCTGDLQNDGLTDLYVGGGHGQAGTLWIQNKQRAFDAHSLPDISKDVNAEEIDCVMFDATGNGYPDLYIVRGGTSFSSTSSLLQDRFYINRGNLEFVVSSQLLPSARTFESGSVAVPHDFNSDGRVDLFVGTRLKPFSTGSRVRNYLLLNLGDGTFLDVTDETAPALTNTEMVTDALWQDLNKDGSKELILATEWGPLRIFETVESVESVESVETEPIQIQKPETGTPENNGGEFHTTTVRFVEKTNEYGLSNFKGLWSSIAIDDFNGDGYPEIVAGNHGLNTLYGNDEPLYLPYQTEELSQTNPKYFPGMPVLTMFAGDINRDGWVEQVYVNHMSQDPSEKMSYPLMHQPEYLQIFPHKSRAYPTHATYAGIPYRSLFSEEELNRTERFDVHVLSSYMFWNRAGNTFSGNPLPPRAQLAPIMAIHVLEMDTSDRKGFLAGGNWLGMKPNPGSMDASQLMYYEVLEHEQIRSVPAAVPQIDGEIRGFADIGVRMNRPSGNSAGEVFHSMHGGSTKNDGSALVEVGGSKGSRLLIVRYGETPVMVKRVHQSLGGCRNCK